MVVILVPRGHILVLNDVRPIGSHHKEFALASLFGASAVQHIESRKLRILRRVAQDPDHFIADLGRHSLPGDIRSDLMSGLIPGKCRNRK